MLVIPMGWDVFVEYRNADPQMAHSLGVDRATADFPTDFTPLSPAFPNAHTPGAGTEKHATPPGGVSSFRFKATEEGDFTLVCYVPGHAAVGEYLRLRISSGATLPSFSH